MGRIVAMLAVSVALVGCGAPDSPSCALEKLAGRSGKVAYDDASQPWPCGQAPATNSGCSLASDVCDLPIVFDCGDRGVVELDQSALTYSRGDCTDVHAIHWVSGE